MDDFEKELKLDFLVEASEMLEMSEQSFLGLSTSDDNTKRLNEIFRFAHNLKGTSQAVGFENISTFTHNLEEFILKLQCGENTLCENIRSFLLKCNDHIKYMVTSLQNNVDTEIDSTQLLDELKALLSGSNADTTETVSDLAEAEEELPNAIEKPLATPASFQKTSTTAPADKFIRVSIDKVEKLNNYVGELILLQTVLQQKRFVHIHDDLANKSISQLSKLSKEIQEISMSLRMVPIRSCFQKMQRVVHDVSRQVGKEIHLTLKGEDTEIDKIVLESLTDPLTHLVRNAVDHGIEDKEHRLVHNKSEAGNIKLQARHQGNYLNILIEDDGKGLDLDAIRIKAIEKSLIEPDQVVSDDEMLQMIFQPGFSTREEVSEVSGRGVGMDVVKTNIESLGGQVFLYSAKGTGSTFSIKLPLTLAIVEGIVSRAGDHQYIFPLSQIREFIRAQPNQVTQHSQIGPTLTLRDQILPIYNLCDDLKLSNSKIALEDSIFVICNLNSKAFAVRVDQIVNQQQVVVKPLKDEIKNKEGLMGGTILGDGRPAFIVDLEGLYKNRLQTVSNNNQGYKEAN